MRLQKLFPVLFLLGACAAPHGPQSSMMGEEVSTLRQEHAELSRQVETLQQRLQDMEMRLQAQQAALAGITSGGPTQMVTPSGQNASQPGAVTNLSVLPKSGADTGPSATDLYLKAFSDYAAGRFPAAISGFSEFLQRYPNNNFAGNAQFWLGECYFSQRLLSRAAQEFALVVEQYPQSGKAPDALLRMSTVFQELQQPQRAEQALTLLLDRYPQSAAAEKARNAQ